MRTIKFRGKRLDNGSWLYGDLRLRADRASIVCRVFDEGKIYYKEFAVIPETVGQFTGLHDKDGREIYEGDVIRSDCGNGEARHLISFFDIIASFVAEMLPDNGINDYCTLSQAWVLKYNKEVIGNIHDNPELLEQ